MNASQPVDLQAVDAYWKSRNLVDDRYRPYYLRWLQRFLLGPGGSSKLAPQDALQAFVQLLEQDGRTEDWQIRQAARAVEFYQKHYLRHLQETGASGPSAVAAQPETFESALQETRTLIRLRHYAYTTEQTYLGWLTRYSRFADQRRLPWAHQDTARTFLADLAVQQGVAASTQNQAFNAILFLLREVLGQDAVRLDSVRARRSPHLPLVLSEGEVKKVLDKVDGIIGLILRLIYGSGLRISECLRLRVKDLDFDNRLVMVRSGKGNKDRSTLLPGCLVDPLRSHLEDVKALHDQDLATGYGDVELPYALSKKYPKAAWEWAWQYCFPARYRSIDPRSNAVRRHHVDEQVLQRAMRVAVVEAGITKPAHVHTLRHSFATALLLHGVNIREVQQYLGHSSVETTMIYTHVIRGLDSTAISPLDAMCSTK